MGVLQGAVLSHFVFSLQNGSLTSRHCRLLKYADDFVLCNSYSKCSDQKGLDDDLSRLVPWSANHGLIITKQKCIECLFYSKNTSHELPFAFLNGESLSREQTSRWLGLLKSILSSQNALNCLFIRRFRSMNVHKSPLWWIVSAYPFNFILLTDDFPRGPLNEDCASFRKCLRLLSTSSGVSCTHKFVKFWSPNTLTHANAFLLQ